ncbi:hypothetical protein AB0F71_01845 [Kitasatospora sp. NPDC028055]
MFQRAVRLPTEHLAVRLDFPAAQAVIDELFTAVERPTEVSPPAVH